MPGILVRQMPIKPALRNSEQCSRHHHLFQFAQHRRFFRAEDDSTAWDHEARVSRGVLQFLQPSKPFICRDRAAKLQQCHRVRHTGIRFCDRRARSALRAIRLEVLLLKADLPGSPRPVLLPQRRRGRAGAYAPRLLGAPSKLASAYCDFSS